MDLILKYEVGGGKSYYEKRLRRPTWPGASSGVTVGVGYDLGYKAASTIRKDWKGLISSRDLERLVSVSQTKGSSAKSLVSKVRDIEIPWDAALKVFQKTTIPRFIANTKRAFPGVEKLHPSAFGALVSLVFNRGGSMRGSTRAEMLRIKGLVPKKDYTGIAREIRAMKRLWSYKTLRGLHLRRDAEAKLVDSAAKL